MVPTTGGDWTDFVTRLEQEVAEFELALLCDAELPLLAQFVPTEMGPLPAELRQRAEHALRAVAELEQAVAVRLDQIARELTAGAPRRHELTPSYGGLDVDC